MSTASKSDSFSIFLHHLSEHEIRYMALGDGRHVLSITGDIDLYVRPAEDDGTVARGLRALAAAAAEMAGALEEIRAARTEAAHA